MLLSSNLISILEWQDWFRFSVAFWHTFRGTGGDPFGAQTKFWPWEDGTNSLNMAKRRSTLLEDSHFCSTSYSFKYLYMIRD